MHFASHTLFNDQEFVFFLFSKANGLRLSSAANTDSPNVGAGVGAYAGSFCPDIFIRAHAVSEGRDCLVT